MRFVPFISEFSCPKGISEADRVPKIILESAINVLNPKMVFKSRLSLFKSTLMSFFKPRLFFFFFWLNTWFFFSRANLTKNIFGSQMYRYVRKYFFKYFRHELVIKVFKRRGTDSVDLTILKRLLSHIRCMRTSGFTINKWKLNALVTYRHTLTTTQCNVQWTKVVTKVQLFREKLSE